MRIALAVLSWLILVASAHAHAVLSQTSPAAGAVLNIPPQEIVLTFTLKLERAFSTVTVTNSNGDEASQGKVQVSGNTMRIGFRAMLGAGTYKVIWRAISLDTHKTEGSFTFRVMGIR
jgi:copper resistance protein C